MNNDVIYYDPKLLHLIEYRNHYQTLVTLVRTLEQQQVHGSRVEEAAGWSDISLNSIVVCPRP